MAHVIEKTQPACSCYHEHHDDSFLKIYLPAILSLLMLGTGIFLDYSEAGFFSGVVRLLWYIVAYIPVGFPVLKEAFLSIRSKDYFNEFSLMAIATLGAFYIGEYPEAVAVMLFYGIGELFQGKAVSKAKKNINALLDIRPEISTVIRKNEKVVMTSDEVSVGEVIEVKIGERVSLDGFLQDESAFFNTSALTGESVPRNIKEGEEVLAGMIVTDKVVRIKVIKPFGQSVFARILELVQEAAERKAPAEKFIHKLAKIYTPIVVGLAILIVSVPFIYSLFATGFIYVFNDWLYRGLVFLVISCPCALVISIPLGYFGGIGAASKQGILFKGANYLDIITKVNTVVMDKTGTITEGNFVVQEVNAAGIESKKLLQLVASVEAFSNHPIAKAIVSHCKNNSIELLSADHVKEVAGYGMSANIDNKEILIGNTKLLKLHDISYPLNIDLSTDTIVVVAIEKKYAGSIFIADTIKANVAQTIKDLKVQRIADIIILSGDKSSTVEAVAEKIGVDAAYGDLLPEGKVKYIEELKSDTDKVVAFVGDGINDAAVLALSDLGVSMGVHGSDVAIETADVVIQTDQPEKLVTAIKIGKLTKRIVYENIILAFTIKLVVLILGVGGYAALWEAVFADVGAALIAILNAVRIMKIAEKY